MHTRLMGKLVVGLLLLAMPAWARTEKNWGSQDNTFGGGIQTGRIAASQLATLVLPNGYHLFCTDCDFLCNPGGTGANAFRVNGVWVCSGVATTTNTTTTSTTTTVVTTTVTTTTLTPPALAGSGRWFGVVEQTAMNGSIGMVSFGMTKSVESATRAAFDDASGSYIEYTTSTSDGGVAGITVSISDPTAKPSILPDTTIVMSTGVAADIASVRLWMGFVQASLNGTDTPAGAQQTAAFRYSTVAGDTNWAAILFDGTTVNTINTGVVVTASTRYILRVRFVTAATVEFSINGTVVATSSTNVPAAATAMGIQVDITNKGAGTARKVRLRKVYCEGN